MSEKRISLKYWLVALGLAALTVSLSSPGVLRDKNRYLAPPPEKIEYFHFGFNESMADSFWLRWIQDADVCQTYLAPVVELKDTFLGNDPQTKIPRHRVCEKSWGFKMLDAVTKLAPEFTMPYLLGASALAVLIEDFEGSTVIYERGLAVYPNDWDIAYRAAYHYLFNLQDLPTAAKLLNRVADNGGPYWVRSLAARMFEKAGQLEFGLQTLQAYRATLTDMEAITQVDQRIVELKQRLGSGTNP